MYFNSAVHARARWLPFLPNQSELTTWKWPVGIRHLSDPGYWREVKEDLSRGQRLAENLAHLLAQSFAAKWFGQEIHGAIQHAVMNHGALGVTGQIEHLHVRPCREQGIGH